MVILKRNLFGAVLRFISLLPLLAVVSGCAEKQRYLPISKAEAEQFSRAFMAMLENRDCLGIDEQVDNRELGRRTLDKSNNKSLKFRRDFLKGIDDAEGGLGSTLCHLLENGYQFSALGSHDLDGDQWVAFQFVDASGIGYTVQEYLVQRTKPSLLRGSGTLRITDIYDHTQGAARSEVSALMVNSLLDASSSGDYMDEEEFVDMIEGFREDDFSKSYHYCINLDDKKRSEQFFCSQCVAAASQMGFSEEAEKWQNSAPKARPELYGASLSAADVYLVEGEYKKAIKIQKRALDRIELPCGKIRFNIAACHYLDQEYKHALDEMEIAIAEDGNLIENESGQIVAARIFYSNARYEKAAEMAQMLMVGSTYEREDLEELFSDSPEFLNSSEFKGIFE